MRLPFWLPLTVLSFALLVPTSSFGQTAEEEEAQERLAEAKEAFAAEDFQKSLEAADAALRLYPSLYAAMMYKGLAYEGLGELKRAKGLLKIFRASTFSEDDKAVADEALVRIQDKLGEERKATVDQEAAALSQSTADSEGEYEVIAEDTAPAPRKAARMAVPLDMPDYPAGSEEFLSWMLYRQQLSLLEVRRDTGIAILAGGESRRMGQDKGLLPLLGIPLVERVLLQVEGLSDNVLLVTNQPDEYRRFGVQMRRDVRPGTGPLGGVYSALHHATCDCTLVLSCDMPFVSLPLLEHMLELSQGCDAVVPRLGGSERVQPLRAVYSKSCIDPIATALDAGRRRVISFFERVNVRYIEMDEIERLDPGAGTFFNVNTPSELTIASEMAADYPLP